MVNGTLISKYNKLKKIKKKQKVELPSSTSKNLITKLPEVDISEKQILPDSQEFPESKNSNGEIESDNMDISEPQNKPQNKKTANFKNKNTGKKYNIINKSSNHKQNKNKTVMNQKTDQKHSEQKKFSKIEKKSNETENLDTNLYNIDRTLSSIQDYNKDKPKKNINNNNLFQSEDKQKKNCSLHNISDNSGIIVADQTENNITNKKSIPETLKKDMDSIKYMIRTINYFIKKFKNSDDISEVETIVNPYYSASAYHFEYFIPLLRNINLDHKFVYNSKIKGKSGSLIFFTSDFAYTIKVIRHSEFNVINNLIDKFVSYHINNKHSLLVKYVGIFKIQFKSKTIHFVMMENVLNGIYKQIYDLKGNRVTRTNIGGIMTEENWNNNKLFVYNKDLIIEQIKKDTMFLSSLNLMDYSLVIAKNAAISHSDFNLYDGKSQISEFNFNKPKKTYSIGIVDTLTVYDTKKWLESLWNAFCCHPHMSSVNPVKYQERFMGLVKFRCFKSLENEIHRKNSGTSLNRIIKQNFSYSQDNLFESGEDA